ARGGPLSVKPDAPSGEGRLKLGPHDWGDVAVDMVLRNGADVAVTLRARDGDGVVFGLRPFRHLDQLVVEVKRGAGGQRITGPPLQLDKVETTKQLVAEI